MKRFCAVLLLLLTMLTAVSAWAEPALPELTADGFLPTGLEPYIYASRDEGRWVYADDELYINIIRYQSDEKNNEMVWFETEIKCTGTTRLTSLLTTEGKAPGRAFRVPQEIADAYGVVLAFNDDYFGNRWYNDMTQGIIIRDRVVYSEETKKNDANAFPALEVMALFEDGSLKTFKSQRYTAQEYLDMGVTDTYAFGPILVENGQRGQRMYDEEYSPYREPRTALGMLAPNHYIVLTVNGRSDDSRGARLTWLADKMIELGAVEAMNLDGGRTTYLYFMGDVINVSENAKKSNMRKITSMIGIGQAR